jgi:hypothetical protein
MALPDARFPNEAKQVGVQSADDGGVGVILPAFQF